MSSKIPELFIPPRGLTRSLPLNIDKYNKILASLGPFSMNVYDIDICTLYRQADDLKVNIKKLNGVPYIKYVNQIRETIKDVLDRRGVDSEFYLEHFYYVIKPDDPSYLPLLAYFFSLSDPLLIIPELEYHLKESFNYDSNDPLGKKGFLSKIEFSVCNAIRTIRFPQDYYVKHDKIINWVYTKREAALYQKAMNEKFEALIASLNRINPSQKISDEIINSKSEKSEKLKPEVFVVPEMINILIEDIKGYFNEKNIESLRFILSGEAEPSLKVMFNGQANQLIDVFRLYKESKFIEANKRDIAEWICMHFTYRENKSSSFTLFDNGTAELLMYGAKPVKKENRIQLNKLPKARLYYYSRKKQVKM